MTRSPDGMIAEQSALLFNGAVFGNLGICSKNLTDKKVGHVGVRASERFEHGVQRVNIRPYVFNELAGNNSQADRDELIEENYSFSQILSPDKNSFRLVGASALVMDYLHMNGEVSHEYDSESGGDAFAEKRAKSFLDRLGSAVEADAWKRYQTATGEILLLDGIKIGFDFPVGIPDLTINGHESEEFLIEHIQGLEDRRDYLWSLGDRTKFVDLPGEKRMVMQALRRTNRRLQKGPAPALPPRFAPPPSWRMVLWPTDPNPPEAS